VKNKREKEKDIVANARRIGLVLNAIVVFHIDRCNKRISHISSDKPNIAKRKKVTH
jgi:hypothetical protein